MADNESESKQILPSRSETIAEVIDSMLAVKGKSYQAVIYVILGLLSLSWLSDSLLPIIQEFAVWLNSYQREIPSENKFPELILRASLPVVIFVFLICIFSYRRLKNLKAIEYNRIASEPQRGLIMSLSDYKYFGDKYPKIEDLEKAIDENGLNEEEFYNDSNWGQLAFVVAHHSSLLQKCWIVTTSESSKYYACAAKLVHYVSQKNNGRNVSCKEINIKDANDISETARAVSNVYQNLGEEMFGLSPNDVITNFTGGTAAMSGGMILATLDERRKTEYVSQQYTKHLSNRLLRDNAEKFAIVSPVTNLIAAERLSRKR